MKPADRRQRVADEIKRIVAESLRRDVNDYDLSMVTILRCEVTADYSEATLRYSVLGDEKYREQCGVYLNKVVGFVQRKLASKLKMYRTPRIRFQFDSAIDDTMDLEKLFDQINRERETDE